MKIALIGYGKMGKVIEKLATERNHQIVCKFNSENPLNSNELRKAEIAIEFTRPELANHHIKICADNRIPVVVGTTAWLDNLSQIKEYIEFKNGSLIYSSNFSLGVNIFFEINKTLAKLMHNYSAYNTQIKETHHTEKLDAPSGTAISIAKDIIDNNKKYSDWSLVTDKSMNIATNSIPVIAERRIGVPGTHIVSYKSKIDQIEIKHEAHNREGFALGSIVAAEFLIDKKGVFTMSDVLKF